MSPWGRRARLENQLDPGIADLFNDWLLFLDPPEHEKLRQEMLKPFTAAPVAALEPMVTELCQSLLPQNGVCRAEIVGAVTQPLPIAVIARLMGIPRSDFDLIAGWARALRAVLDSPERAGPEAQASVRQMRSYFLALAQDQTWARLQVAAGHNGLSDLTKKFPPEVVAANLALLVFAGHETTVHLMGSLLLHLALRPHVWKLLRARHDLIPNAVTEALRLESPVQKMCRWSHDWVEIADRAIPPRQMLILLLGAANRDPARFASPDSFDISRDCSNHIAFGRGRHLCLGRLLAMLETTTLLRVLLQRWTAVGVTKGGWQWLSNSSFRGLGRLELDWEQGAAEP
jgi:cytochrome P450